MMNTRQEKADWLIDNLNTISFDGNPRELYAKMTESDLDSCIHICRKDLERQLTREDLQIFLNIISKYQKGSMLVVEHPDESQ